MMRRGGRVRVSAKAFHATSGADDASHAGEQSGVLRMVRVVRDLREDPASQTTVGKLECDEKRIKTDRYLLADDEEEARILACNALAEPTCRMTYIVSRTARI